MRIFEIDGLAQKYILKTGGISRNVKVYETSTELLIIKSEQLGNTYYKKLAIFHGKRKSPTIEEIKEIREYLFPEIECMIVFFELKERKIKVPENCIVLFEYDRSKW